MITIQNTEQLDRFIRSTRGVYNSILDSGKRFLDKQNGENAFTRVLRNYFSSFSRSNKIRIEIDNIEFRQLASIYIAESKAYPRIG